LRLDFSLSRVPEPAAGAGWLPADPLLALVFQVGLAIIACSLLMLLAVFALRMRLLVRRRREHDYESRWRPLLAECVFGVPERLPEVPRKLRYHFLKLWNYHHESLVGGARANLVALAERMGLERLARELMRSGDLRERLIAVVTLGHLGDRSQWHELRALVSDRSPMLSLAAARALLDIDAAATLAWLVTVMAAREDWPLARVVAMLREAGPDRVTQPLIAAVEAASRVEGGQREVVRLLRMMEVAHTERVAPLAGRIARESRDPEVIAAALRLVQDPRDLDFVRTMARHEQWFVRLAALRVLGRIGGPADRVLLVERLGDPHWWVRYHAARALVALPGTRLEDLEKVRATLADRFAADMLGEAIAEARA
jgi:hypothetical protein